MKSVILILFLFFNLGAQATESSRHKHHVVDKQTKQNGIIKYNSTKLLEEQVSKIEKIVQNKNNHLPIMAKEINLIVDEVFNTCKLPTDADAALHPILAKILDGVERLRKNDRAGLEIISKAVNEYKHIFSNH